MEEEDGLGDEYSGRRSRPINLATRLGVLVPGELLHSEDKSSDRFVLI